MFNPFRWFRSPPDTLVIDRGRVNCPPRGTDVELDRCAACESMREIDENANPPFVRCRPKTLPVIADLEYRHGHLLY